MNGRYLDPARTPSNSPESEVVYVVDNDIPEREALNFLISSAGWQTKTFSSAEEFISLPRTRTPSCLMTELRLPGMSALQLQRLILDRTEMPIIFMSGHDDVRATVQAMKAGAFEFLTKPLSDDEVLQTIQQAIECSRAELRYLTKTLALQERYKSLSKREREVLSLVVAGRLNKQVAGDLGISEITVKAHRGRVMRKMQARTLPELVRMAAQVLSRTPGTLPNIDALMALDHPRRCYGVFDIPRYWPGNEKPASTLRAIDHTHAFAA